MMTAEQRSRLDAVLADYLQDLDRGVTPDRRALVARHPDLADALTAWFDDEDRMARLRLSVPRDEGSSPPRQAAGGAHGAHGAHGVHGVHGVHGAPADAPSDDILAAGTSLGAYRIEEVIARGGMGVIYKARHRGLDKIFAIKVLARRLAGQPDLVERFQREARALARLDHPNIVRISDLGQEGSVSYFVMEYVEGVTLRDLMRAGEMTEERALGLIPAICLALEYAHEQGIVHRDIKPENILLDVNGVPRIADFGLARVLLADGASGGLTATEVVMGTYNYMAPEQKRSARVDHRADIYALGVVLYEMLTGRLPEDVPFVPPSRRARIDGRIDGIVLKALQAEPSHRYQRASDFGRDVSDISRPGRGGAGAARDGAGSAASSGEERALRIVHVDGDAEAGTGRAACLRIVTKGRSALAVRTWSREEIGLRVVGPVDVGIETVGAADARWLDMDAASGVKALALHLPGAAATIHVPEDLPVQIVAKKAGITVAGLRAPLHVALGKGQCSVRDHVGALVVEREGDENLEVSGLRSERFHLAHTEGGIRLTGLRQQDGTGHVTSSEGAIVVGFVEDECALQFDAESVNGETKVSVGTVLADAGHPHRGRLGAGTGRLTVLSHEGDVSLLGHVDAVGRIAGEGVGSSLLWSLGVAGFLAWQEHYWATGCILIFWTGSELLKLLRIYRRFRRFGTT